MKMDGEIHFERRSAYDGTHGNDVVPNGTDGLGDEEMTIKTALVVLTCMGVLYIVLNLYSLAGEL